MKRVILFLMTLLILLVGCNSKDAYDSYDRYYEYMNRIVEQESFADASYYYNVSVEMVKTDTNKYSYYVVIDNPNISMYDISAMCVDINDIHNADIMAPTVGIFDSYNYHMIPYQEKMEDGYTKGIVLSGTKEFAEGVEPKLDLRLLVQWYNSDRSVLSREFIKMEYKYVDPSQSHEDELPSEDTKEESNESSDDEETEEDDE